MAQEKLNLCPLDTSAIDIDHDLNAVCHNLIITPEQLRLYARMHMHP